MATSVEREAALIRDLVQSVEPDWKGIEAALAREADGGTQLASTFARLRRRRATILDAMRAKMKSTLSSHNPKLVEEVIAESGPSSSPLDTPVRLFPFLRQKCDCLWALAQVRSINLPWAEI